MKRENLKIWLAHALMLLCFGAILVYYMPREQTFSYDFTVGKPWKFSLITAKYDFPIDKPASVLAAERDSVRRCFAPYLQVDSTICESELLHLESDFRHGDYKKLTASHVAFLKRELREAYSVGLMDNEELSALVDSGTTRVRVVEGFASQSKEVKSLLTTRSAYVKIVKDAERMSAGSEWLAECNVGDYLRPNVTIAQQRSLQSLQDELASITSTSGMAQAGEKIVDYGEIVTPNIACIIESMKRDTAKRNTSSNSFWYLITGQVLLVIFTMCLFGYFLYTKRRDLFMSVRTVLLFYVLFTVFSVGTSLIEYSTSLSAYLLPFAMAAIFIRVFMDARTAFMAQVMLVLLCATSMREPGEFMFVQIVSGFVAIYSFQELSSRSQIFSATAYVIATAALAMLIYDLVIRKVTIDTFDVTWYQCLVGSALPLILTYPIMYVMERLFGFISNVTLIELSNVNTPLLRQMSREAQGTFAHSMQVANLAAEVAAKLGGKVELVRTGALYHDIGKMKNPAFFTENQSGVNPHDSLSEERSAQIIIDHIRDGLEMAEKYHLPVAIRQFIATHHGRSKAKYFYINYVNKHPGEPVNEELFTYPGPNPTTLEQAILVMSDSIEAASRSLKVITDESIADLVNKIVDGQVAEGFFKNTPMTFAAIEEAKKQFIATLRILYHTRISYPELKKPTEEREPETQRSLLDWSYGRKARRTLRSRN